MCRGKGIRVAFCKSADRWIEVDESKVAHVKCAFGSRLALPLARLTLRVEKLLGDFDHFCINLGINNIYTLLNKSCALGL